MTFKDIVVHQGGDARAGVRLDAAISIGKPFGARITGVYPLAFPAIPGYAQVEIGAEVIEQTMAELRRTAAGVEQAFSQRLKSEDVKGEWRLIEGSAIQAMALCARYADLLVVAQDNPDDPGSADGLADELVLAAGRPVVVMPYVGNYAKIGERVMVAWNGTREATRAVHDALPLLARAEEVVVYGVNPPDAGHIPGTDLSTHLARHDVKATAHHVFARDMEVGDALLSALSDYGIDLLVMGAYGHSRIRELALGGATRHVLRSMTVPVLLSH